ncbi:MAG: hypothetical protein ACXACG_04740 [Candidatus Thorarchaeota archaeon]
MNTDSKKPLWPRIVLYIGAIVLIVDGILYLSGIPDISNITLALQGIGAIMLLLGLVLVSITGRKKETEEEQV